MKKPARKRSPVLRPTKIPDRVSFTCPDCHTEHTFKLLTVYECISLSDEDTYCIEYTSGFLPVLSPIFICTRDRCNFEAVLSLDTK